MKRFVLSLVFLAHLSLVVLAPLPMSQLTGAYAAGTEEVVVGYIPIADCLQLYVAEAMGYFQQEGISIQKRPMKGGTAIAPAVESGDIQVGWSNTVSIIIAHAKGFDFTFVTPGALEEEGGHRTHSLLVPSNSQIKQIADLAGKVVAINTLGNVNELSIMALAEQYGIDMKTIRLVEIPFPDMEAALKNNSVDAALVAEPFVTLSVMHGSARVLEASAHKAFGDRFMIASWFVKKSWIEKNPAKAEGFARAIAKASDYITGHPKEVSEHLLTATKLSADLVGKISLPAYSPSYDLADLQKLIDMAAKHKFINAPFPAKEIVYQSPR
jgi:NitT/TauT family transport system substrate-binding protein